jgi:hypothetical protein
MMFDQMSVYELTAMRSTLLRGVASVRYSSADEREVWKVQADEITAELTRRNEVQS